MTTLKRQPETVKSFCVSFFKKRPLIGARVALAALRRERNNLIVRKRHKGVNFDEVKRGEKHKWGFPLFCIIKLTQYSRDAEDVVPYSYHNNIKQLAVSYLIKSKHYGVKKTFIVFVGVDVLGDPLL